MLFDLRGRGRRRAVQVIYLCLALLMGGGLVLFGIGGATNGGLLDAFKNDSGSSSSTEVFDKQAAAAERRVKLHPRDAAAWSTLARVRYQEAVGVGLDESSGTFNDDGKEALSQADQAWQKALSLTDKPDPNVAASMVQLYGPGGLDKPDKAVAAFEVQLAATAEPTWQQYATYAQLAYMAKQDRKGDLAGQKALKLAPADEREQAKAVIDSAKQQAAQATSTNATTVAPTTTAAG